ncbi:MAG: GGDEF domain-containing protein [Eubacteriales bacterium]
MQSILYIEISATGMILLLIVLFSQRQATGSSAAQRRFNLLIYTAIAMLIADAACWVLDGQQFPRAWEVNFAVETFYYTLHLLLPFFWANYVEITLSSNLEAAKRRINIIAIPLLIFIFALAFNHKYGFLFTIDSENVYHRAYGVYAYAGLSYAYLVYASVRALIKARNSAWVEDKRLCYTMAFFVVFPFLGGIVQLFVYGLNPTWILSCVSILLVYIYSQNRQISTDPMTGLNNRRELTKFLLRETREYRNGSITLVMMDVDGFKQINDTYGHFYGDNVIVAVADILKSSLKSTDLFLARYGGDEFCIVIPAESRVVPDELLRRIQTNISEWNRTHKSRKPISLSIGYANWDEAIDRTYESLISRADQKMYEVKRKRKHATAEAS